MKQIFTFLTNHPKATVKGTIALLLSIVVLQNYEATSIDFLFWTITSSPKVIVILVSMLLGAIIWELSRPSSFKNLINKN